MSGSIPVPVCRHNGDRLALWCPACDDIHQITVPPAPNCWDWDGDLYKPTISPSIKVTSTQWGHEYAYHRPNHAVAPGGPTTCHSFVTGGQWHYLGDCTHTLAGQTVECVPYHYEYTL